MTTLNEPSAGFKPNYPFNSIGVSAEMFREWIAKDLGPALEAAGYGKDKLKLMIVDDNVSLIFLYANRILGSPKASKYVSGVAVHWYENRYFDYVDFERVHKMYPDFFILSTEACNFRRKFFRIKSMVFLSILTIFISQLHSDLGIMVKNMHQI